MKPIAWTLALLLMLLATEAIAQKQGGILRVYHRDSPASLSIAPCGAWAPGNQAGYNNTSGPAVTGIASLIWKMPRATSLASTCSAIVPA